MAREEHGQSGGKGRNLLIALALNASLGFFEVIGSWASGA
jgi:hypothetical protein